MSDRDLSIDWQSSPIGPRPSINGELRGTIQAIVADDNTEVLLATTDLIVDFGGVEVVSQASNVEDAVEAAARHRPDIAFIEAGLRGGGAEAAAKRIKAVSPGTSVVALASARELELVLKLRAAGADGCYEKETLSQVLPEILASIPQR
jgi:DNA-binding NarL/FixJ family response regulator